jgi:ribosome maturation factor RimP
LCADPDLKTLVSDSIVPIVKGLGFEIVELRVNRGKRLVDIEIIVYKPQGVSIEDCAEISQTLHPRLELIPHCEGLVLRVSSPGLDRQFKSNGEFAIFKGHGVKVLFPGESEWRAGTIGEVTENGFTLISASDSKFFTFDAIKKARLFDVQGGSK